MRVVPATINQVLRLWWRLTRPITVGVRGLLIREGTALLVKHTYGEAWYLPGGGVKRGETLEEALRRELGEEVGAQLGQVDLFGVYSNFGEGKSDHVVVYLCTDFTVTGETDREIERLGFFGLEDLPGGVSGGTRLRIAEYLRDTGPYFGLWCGNRR
jgi:ADP-ribose pyrophosphatase YjhB (NUDIX family)